MPTRDDQDGAEALDSDKLDDLQDRPDQEGTYPPERLLGATDPTADEWASDSVTSRRDRLQPDPVERLGDDDPPRTPRAAGAGEETTEDEAVARLAAVAGLDTDAADDADRHRPLQGRLTAPGAEDDAAFAVDDEGQAIGTAAPGDDLSAEEAAVHLQPE